MFNKKNNGKSQGSEITKKITNKVAIVGEPLPTGEKFGSSRQHDRQGAARSSQQESLLSLGHLPRISSLILRKTGKIKAFSSFPLYLGMLALGSLLLGNFSALSDDRKSEGEDQPLAFEKPLYVVPKIPVDSWQDFEITLINKSEESIPIYIYPIKGQFRYKGGNFPGMGGTCTSRIEKMSRCTLIVTHNPHASNQDDPISKIKIQYGKNPQRTVKSEIMVETEEEDEDLPPGSSQVRPLKPIQTSQK